MMSANRLWLVAMISSLLCCQTAVAGPLWSTNSLTGLHGERYKLTPDATAEVVTFEHASRFQNADLFFFVDRFRFDDGEHSTYSELSPRWLFYRFNRETGDSLLKQLSLAATWERGRGPGTVDFDHYLTGFGLDLNLPHFRYSKFNVYYRNNEDKADNWQLTVNFALPFAFADSYFLYDGFIDWTSATEDGASSMNATTQLKWDISRYWGGKQPLYIGMEYVYWRNKYGVRDVNEHNPNLLLKWHF